MVVTQTFLISTKIVAVVVSVSYSNSRFKVDGENLVGTSTDLEKVECKKKSISPLM